MLTGRQVLCDIAEQLGVHPRTVRRALQRGGPPAPRRGRRGSLLDPYRAQVDQLLSEGVWNAVVLLRELQAKGYAGGISILIASGLGVPVSTTHTITGAIVGVGSANRVSAVRWGVATRIVWAWILTIPMSGAIAAVAFLVIR